jgi:HAD superfamily hydrolase (TIGR01549 family)
MNKALFWDFDGTLVYSNHMWSETVYQVLKDNVPGCMAGYEDIRPFVRTCFTWHTPHEDFTGMTGDKWWDLMFERFSRVYTQFSVEQAAADELALMIKPEILNIKNYRLYSDSVETLRKAIEMGYSNYIVSNNYPELEQTIAGLGLTSFFSDVIVSAKVGYDKPRKEIFDIALKVAGNPDRCLMVGDNVFADVYGAKLAGIQSVLVHSKDESDADFTFDSLEQFQRIL